MFPLCADRVPDVQGLKRKLSSKLSVVGDSEDATGDVDDWKVKLARGKCYYQLPVTPSVSRCQLAKHKVFLNAVLWSPRSGSASACGGDQNSRPFRSRTCLQTSARQRS